MTKLLRLGLATSLLTGAATLTPRLPFVGEGAWVGTAHAETDDEKKKRQQHQQQQQQQQKPPQSNSPPSGPKPGGPSPEFKQVIPKGPTGPQGPSGPTQQFKTFGQPTGPTGPSGPPGNSPTELRKHVVPGTPGPTGPQGPTGPSSPQFKTFGSPTGPTGPTSPPGSAPTELRKHVTPGSPGTPPGPPKGTFIAPTGPGKGPLASPGPLHIKEVQKERRVHEEGGRRIIIEPGNRTIIRENNRLVIRHDENERFLRLHRDARINKRPDGTTETYFIRPDGTRIITIVDGSGRLLRRYRRDGGGREFNIIDNRRFYRNVAIGVGVVGLGLLLTLPRPVINMPMERYIVDYDVASDDDLYESLMAPPVMPLERAYSLDEVRENLNLRDLMPRIDLVSVTFESGSFEVAPDQYGKLERIARAINRILERKPDEVFLVEGHTDAVGKDEDNLSLSDRRAQSVAQILSEQFGVPPENLVTQGYGEQFLKIDTQDPERRNRRVAVRRVTPLMAEQR